MKIKELCKGDSQKYNELAVSVGSIFNTLEWTGIFEGKIQHYGIYNDGDKLIGGFFTFKEKIFGFSLYRNPPFTPEIGPFIKIDAQSITNRMDTWKEVMSLMSDFMDDLPYSIIYFALPPVVTDTQPFIWGKFKVTPGYTYIIDLNQTEEDIWENLSKKRRHDVNKALKDGLVAKQVDDMKIVKALCLKTFSRQGKKINVFYLDKILFEFATHENSYAFATFRNDIPVATTFFLYDKSTSYALLGGYDHDNKHYGAGVLSDWEGIKHAKKLGLSRFDFEGSMVPQIERYLRGFGGRMTSYYNINKARLPLEIVLKLIKRELF